MTGDDLLNFKNTSEIPVPDKLIDQVIGQEKGVEIVKKAAKQKRNLLLMGNPGTGKSMLAQAMAELIPTSNLVDILIKENPLDENCPSVFTVPAGQGRKIVQQDKIKLSAPKDTSIFIPLLLMLLSIVFVFFLSQWLDRITVAALILGLFIFGAMLVFVKNLNKKGLLSAEYEKYKIIVDNSGKKSAPFIDATGSHSGALFGDVRHDPLQSGAFATPAHLRCEAGAIHRANGGVLFIDEIAVLSPKSQQELLTAMQEKKAAITGKSEMSSGALVRSEPVPCDFILVAAGNIDDLKRMHPALRNRIVGYGYEVLLNDTMEDTPENCKKIVQFVAQEVKKDGKIPHFSRSAVLAIIEEARRKAGRKGKLTVKLRELGGLIRAAGDLAKEQNSEFVEEVHIKNAKKLAKSLEMQLAGKLIDLKKDYRVFTVKGESVGKVNGLAVIGGDAGLVIPIEAEVAPASSKNEGKIIATGRLGAIAKEAIENVSAIVKKHSKTNLSNYDIHVQFLQTYEGVEGDSASVSVAVAVISALTGIPVRQDIAMTGSLSIKGEVLPVGGVSSKIEAAISAGLKTIIIPESNKDDVLLTKENLKNLELIYVKNINDVLKNSLKECKQKKKLLGEIIVE